jgi:hypothetical protein
MLRPVDVPPLHEEFDHLAGRLFRDPEMVRNIHHGRVTSADTDEREAVGGPNIGESALGNSFLDAVDELRCRTEDERSCGEPIKFSHLVSLTWWSIQLII